MWWRWTSMTVLAMVVATAMAWAVNKMAEVILKMASVIRRRMRVVGLIERIPGPPALPVLGNTIDFNVDHDEVFMRLMCGGMMYSSGNGVIRGWNGFSPWVLLYRAHAAEVILGSNKHMDKSREYRYLHPWLGTGLLTSSGAKWHGRRKLLTPAFHFRILEDFIAVFQEQSDVLVRLLQPHAQLPQTPFDLVPFITRCALDIICETAMGVQVNAQHNSESEYVRSVYEIGTIVQNRQSKVWLQPDWLFRLTNSYRKHQKCLKILHEFSNKVIRERKEEIDKQKLQREKTEINEVSNNDHDDDFIVIGKKKRLAFLDLLIEYSQEGKVLSNEDIREEVDTFMFEGHDTTSAAIGWTLFLLGSNPECQEKAFGEVNSIIGDADRPLTLADLQEMRYLECCIKEALRLYPSVPLVARQLNEDVRIGEYAVPAGTTAVVVTYMLHRDPQMFLKPDHFVPERFFPENSAGRHPFAYIPFSAGPRNCIGQKFALLEEKTIISTFLRKYRIEAVDRREDLTLLGELILRSKAGLTVKIFPRY